MFGFSEFLFLLSQNFPVLFFLKVSFKKYNILAGCSIQKYAFETAAIKNTFIPTNVAFASLVEILLYHEELQRTYFGVTSPTKNMHDF